MDLGCPVCSKLTIACALCWVWAACLAWLWRPWIDAERSEIRDAYGRARTCILISLSFRDEAMSLWSGSLLCNLKITFGRVKKNPVKIIVHFHYGAHGSYYCRLRRLRFRFWGERKGMHSLNIDHMVVGICQPTFLCNFQPSNSRLLPIAYILLKMFDLIWLLAWKVLLSSDN